MADTISGYSFEQLCLHHVRQIKQKLGVIGVQAMFVHGKELEDMYKVRFGLIIYLMNNNVHNGVFITLSL